MKMELTRKYTFKQFSKEYYKQFPNGTKDQLQYYWQAYLMMRCS